MTASVAASIRAEGYAVVAGLIDPATVHAIAAAVEGRGEAGGVLGRDDATYGMRDLFRGVPEIRTLAASPPLVDLVETVLGPGVFAVRGLWFDKTPGANWGVPWHQDLTIAVQERREAPGFGPWTIKAGIPHVRPPIAVLEAMITVRIHLDDCGADRGPLRVVPRSERGGRLDAVATREHLAAAPAIDCLVAAGDAVVMRPLVLHSSRAATTPARRRVVHLEYASAPLPEGLEWFEEVGRQSH